VRSVRNPCRQRRVGFWLCSWLLLFCAPLYGIDRDRSLDQLDHTGWTYKEGAPGEVHALAQTTDGYLWLGTATGLFRFDGIRFQPYTPQSGQAFPQRSVASLFAVPDGGLWVGYGYGGVSFIKNGTVTDYGTPEGLPSRAVLAFAQDRQGTIWIAAGKDGLARLEGSRWRKIGTDWGFAGEAYAVFIDHAGTVWVGTPTSVAYLVEGAHQFQIAAQHLLPFVHSFAEGRDGTLWMAEGGYGVRPVPLPGKGDGRAGPAVLVGSLAITFDNQVSLWITSAGTGIRRVPYPEHLHPPKIKGPSAWQFLNSDVEAFTQRDGLTSDFVYCVLQDREGNVWFGTSGGLDRFRQMPVVSVHFQPISYRGALPIPSLHSFTTRALAAGDQGALWAAGMGPGVLLKIQNDKIVTQLRDRLVDCAYRAPNGVVWLATPSSVFRLAHERLDTVGSRPGAVTYNYHDAVPVGQGLILRQLNLPTSGGIAVSPQLRVNAITQDRLSRLWISMESGTFRLETSGWTSLESLGGPAGAATAEFTDSEGRIWFGFADTVATLDGDRVRIFSGKDGVRVGAVTSIQGQGTKLWIGGEFGLEFFDGSRFQAVSPSDGSAFGGVSGIVTDPEGGLWFSENRGIIQIPEAQLQQFGSGKVEYERFGLQDGLTAELRGHLASPSGVQTTDGLIWFATTPGAAWINPKRTVRNPVPPPVLIESVMAGGRKYNNSTFLKLPARIANLQITFTATSLTNPERVRFRYKLEGQDREWQDAGTRREAFYTNLDPRSYQFHVIACNNDGVWNEVGASLNFSIAPAYYQTSWFRAACLALFLVLLWMLYRLRVGSVEQRYIERTRAAEAIASQAAERKQAEEKLWKSEAYLAEAQKLSHTGSFGWDVSSGEIYWSAETFWIFEYEPTTKITIELVLQRVHPEDRAAVEQLIERVSREKVAFEFEHRLLTPDGSVKHLQVMGRPSEAESGGLEFVGAITDITQRRRGEEKLQRSEAYLAEAQSVTHTGSCAIDGNSRQILYWSDEMFRLFAFDPEQGLPMWEQWVQRIHPEDLDKFRAAGDRTFIEKAHCDVEFRIVKPDGTVRHIHAIGHPALSPSGELVQVVGTMVDVTERKRAEAERERLRQAQAELAHINRVSTMGELTASLAHEIKQPLTAALTNAQTCLDWLRRDRPDIEEGCEAAAQVVSDVNRAAGIIDSVSALFKKGPSQRGPVDMNDLIRQMVNLLRNEALRNSVTIRTELAESVPRVNADRLQLQQVFMNLMVNGIDAMKDVTERELSIKSEVADGQVLISVTDAGVGLSPDHEDRIFKAFFTTKETGTGMGLSISRSIIESHGGRLWATANSGKGATFRFTLPAMSRAAHP
jgi:PAS domain S-box-containing protein